MKAKRCASSSKKSDPPSAEARILTVTWQHCWLADSANRPSFDNLVRVFGTWRANKDADALAAAVAESTAEVGAAASALQLRACKR